MSGLALQLVSALLCTLAAVANFVQARKWFAMRKRLRPVGQVIARESGERQLGIVGATPQPGTVLYVLEPVPGAPADATEWHA